MSKRINVDLLYQLSINGLPSAQTIIRYETSCSSKGFLKVNIANTKKCGRKALINVYHHEMIPKIFFI